MDIGRLAGDNGTYTITIYRLDYPSGRKAVDIELTHEHRTLVGFDWLKPGKTSPRARGKLRNYEIELRTLPNSSWGNRVTKDKTDLNHEYTPLTPGQSYEVRVRAINRDKKYQWGYATIHTDECASDGGNICFMNVGGSTTGRINYHADEDTDTYGVSLTSGTTYTIDVKGKSTDDGTLVDPEVALYDQYEDAVTGQTNNDGGTGKNARLTYTATNDAFYYIEVSENGGDARGTYTVSVTEN